jgi:Ca-activated chloride channel homolog
VVTAIAASGATTVVAQTPPADQPSAMIVFDGSGSMWGRLDGDKKQSKLELARDVVRSSLIKAAPGARVGLMSFGHRRQADCSDIELIAAVAPIGDQTRIMAPLDKLNPRGKGPVAQALRDAAKAIGTELQQSVVLIHDNADNCRQDACEAATEIAAAHPKLKIHVVSLGLEKDELARVACIAKATNGQLFDVKDASGVAPAVADAMQLALLSTATSPTSVATGGAPPGTPSATATAPTLGPPGLRLSARLSAASRPLVLPVAWRIFKPDSDVPLFEGYGPDVTALLEPGAYAVEGRVGLVTARSQASVEAHGPTPFNLALDAAAVRLKISELKDGPISNSALVTLRSATPAAGAAARPLWIGNAQDADFVLPAGTYKVHIQDSLVERDETVALAVGEVIDKPIVLGSGRLEVTAVAKVDGPVLDGVTFLVARDDPDAPDGRREIARSAASKAAFVLPSGTYYVTARSGSAEVRQRIGIGAGDTVKRAIPLGLTKVVIAAEPPTGKNASPAATGQKFPISARILSLEGEPREIARQTALAPEFVLTPGRYRIEAAIGSQNVRVMQDVELENSGPRRIALKLDASVVTLKITGATEAIWEVKDAQGMLQLRSSQPSPYLVLAPGRYSVRCDVQGKRLDKTVDILPDGQPRVIEFAVP